MKRIPLAALLALGAFALARADEGAYKTLAGMAQAAPNHGPEDDGAPPDPSMKMGTLRDAVADVPRPDAARRAASPSSPSPEAAVAAPRPASAPAAAAIPAAPAARLWTKLYSTLLPSWRLSAPRSSFEAEVSTGSAAVLSAPPPASRSPLSASRAPLSASRAPLSALMPPPDSEAVSAGERRGMAELMSVPDPQ
ncbi:MAG TPA: hypothetical protein VN915_01180 [Elusimicrobiota bacterium]|nr:hypothetical protein [Elusimicrobiota bacterium]